MRFIDGRGAAQDALRSLLRGTAVDICWDDAGSDTNIPFGAGADIETAICSATEFEQESSGKFGGIVNERAVLIHSRCQKAQTADGESIPLGCIYTLRVYE